MLVEICLAEGIQTPSGTASTMTDQLCLGRSLRDIWHRQALSSTGSIRPCMLEEVCLAEGIQTPSGTVSTTAGPLCLGRSLRHIWHRQALNCSIGMYPVCKAHIARGCLLLQCCCASSHCLACIQSMPFQCTERSCNRTDRSQTDLCCTCLHCCTVRRC